MAVPIASKDKKGVPHRVQKEKTRYGTVVEKEFCTDGLETVR